MNIDPVITVGRYMGTSWRGHIQPLALFQKASKDSRKIKRIGN
jgi:hypothetical protein